jgi:tetratricopeptide (TPR) repeat protein
MRKMAIAASVFWLVSAAVPAGFAQAYVDTEALDTYFPRLQSAADPLVAATAAAEIWRIWLAPDDPELAAEFQTAIDARARENYVEAILILDGIVERWPDYAEAWNQRATLRYVVGDLPGSLEDIDETLAREPRHFGALSGAAMIYLRLGDRPSALAAIVEGLRYHPFLNERHQFPELLPKVEV